jgi:hypothetical protein
MAEIYLAILVVYYDLKLKRPASADERQVAKKV